MAFSTIFLQLKKNYHILSTLRNKSSSGFYGTKRKKQLKRHKQTTKSAIISRRIVYYRKQKFKKK